MSDEKSTQSLYDSHGLMRVAIMLSGGGSTAKSLCEYVHEHTPEKCGFDIALLLSDRKKGCGILDIGKEYDIPAIAIVTKFLSVENPARELNRIHRDILRDYGIDAVAMMGAGQIVDEQIYGEFLTLNDHPADLRPTGPDGQRLYKGWHEEPIMKALSAGETKLHCTVNEADEEPDEGRRFIISDPVHVAESIHKIRELEKDIEKYKYIAGGYQDILKEVGDNKIMALALKCVAKKLFEEDAEKNLYFAGEPVPEGVEYKVALAALRERGLND